MATKKKVLKVLVDDVEAMMLDELRNGRSVSSYMAGLIRFEYDRRQKERVIEKVVSRLANDNPGLWNDMIQEGIRRADTLPQSYIDDVNSFLKES